MRMLERREYLPALLLLLSLASVIWYARQQFVFSLVFIYQLLMGLIG